MTQNEKELLLKDLCARLPYGVKIFHEITDETGNIHTYDGYTLYELSNDGQHITLLNHDDKHGVCEVDVECGVFKPYLRPMSSMTEEEINEFHKLRFIHVNYGLKPLQCVLSVNEIDWLNAHHFDYRDLIEKGIAIEALKDMYKI